MRDGAAWALGKVCNIDKFFHTKRLVFHSIWCKCLHHLIFSLLDAVCKQSTKSWTLYRVHFLSLMFFSYKIKMSDTRNLTMILLKKSSFKFVLSISLYLFAMIRTKWSETKFVWYLFVRESCTWRRSAESWKTLETRWLNSCLHRQWHNIIFILS